MSERKSDKELADALDAQARLLTRGYTRETCHTCGGLGVIRVGRGEQCLSCDGRGFYWRAPITK